MYRDYALNKLTTGNGFLPYNEKIEKIKSDPVVQEADFKKKHHDKINNIDNITLARNNLMEKTGRTEFKMGEIIKEIDKITKGDKGFRIK